MTLRQFVVVIGFALSALVVPLISSFADRIVPSVIDSADSATDQVIWPDGPSDEQNAQTVLTFVAHRLVPSEARMDVLFKLSVPPAVLQQLWDTDLKQYVMHFAPSTIPGNSVGDCILRKEYRQQPVLVRATGIGAVDIQLSDLAENTGALGTEIEGTKVLGIPVRSQPELYPSDWYLLTTELRVALPPSLSLVPAPDACIIGPVGVPSRTGLAYLPFRIKGVKEAGMNGMIIQPTSSSEAASGVADTHNINIRVARDGVRIFYLKTLSEVPAVIVMAFIVTMILVSRLPKQDRRESQLTLVVSMAAVMLAVLPLRAVLVPTELPYFTWLDAALSTATAFMAIGLVGAAALLWRDLLGGRLSRSGHRRVTEDE